MVGAGSAWLWAQATSPGNPAASLLSSLRRWCGGLTLSPSGVAPDWSVVGLLAAAGGGLVLIAMVAQGPAAALRQLLDVPGALRLAREATGRVRKAVQLVMALLALSVVSWIGFQCLGFFFAESERSRMELIQLRRGRSTLEFAAEHAVLASTTPLRDVAGLADVLPALLTAAVLLVAYIRREAGEAHRPVIQDSRATAFGPDAGSSYLGMAFVLFVYALYRLFIGVALGDGLPVGVCLFVEAALLPALMLACDGFLLAWVLVELRDGDPGEEMSGDRLSPARALRLLPGAALACFVALPARYLAASLLLVSQHVPAPWLATAFGKALRWGLGPGLFWSQAASLVGLGMVGVVAWSRGGLGDAFSGHLRTLAREGGRMAVVTMAAAAACGVCSGAAYLACATLPPAGWVLTAADAYAHYATIPVGLWTLAAFIELAARALPVALPAADLVPPPASSEGGASAPLEALPAANRG